MMDFDKLDHQQQMVNKTDQQQQSPSNLTNVSSFQQQQQQQDSEKDPNFYLNAIRHQDVTPTFIANILIKLCDSKFNPNKPPGSASSGDEIVKFANLVVEKLICESPLTEILRVLDSKEFYKKLYQTPNNNQQFDYEKFLQFCRYLCQSDKQGYDIIGNQFFVKVWQHNSHFQYEFLKFCIISDWVQQILNSCISPKLTKKVPQIEILKCPPEYEQDYQIQCWKYLCLTQILLDLSENRVIYPYLEEIFFLPLSKCPDLLVFALLECQSTEHLKEAILTKALLKFICVSPNNLNPNPNATIIIQRIWPSDFVYTGQLSIPQKALLTSMVELYTSSSQDEQSYKLSKILDLSQDLKVLNLLLSSNTYSFVIDLACFASRREYLKLDKWLNDKIRSVGQPFLEACMQFLKRRLTSFNSGNEPSTQLSLPNETYRTILNCLYSSITEPKTILEYEIVNLCKQFPNQWFQQQQQQNQQQQPQFPNAQQQTALPVNMAAVKTNQFDHQAGSQQQFNNDNNNPNSQLRQLTNTQLTQQQQQQQQNYCPEIEQEFSKDIEEEADKYFQRIYNQDQPDTLTIDQFLDMLKRFQESSNKREKDISMCIIRNLFKEYPFLSQYPDKELVITGEIFGGIVMNNFVKGFSLIQALKCVMNALKQTQNTRYFTFGQAALNKMKNRFKDFPQFCQHLSSIPVYRDLPANLIEYIDYGKQGMDPPSVSMMGKRVQTFKTTPNATANTNNNSNNNNNNADQQFQLNNDLVQPPNTFQDKVAFIINNLSQLNLPKKAEEFRDLFQKETLQLKDQYFIWFSNYFVMKRVSLEANFHELYATFMIKVNLLDLSSKVLLETYKNIRFLLRTIKDQQDNFNDRTLLKNLGQWLGLITLAQNKPILTRNLDLRNLLIEAYHRGINQLQYVVPFVTKVLLGSGKSKVFRPPCPWTVKLIKILVELHSEPDLKLNLKFEVEVLCKNLEITLEDYLGKSQDLKNKEYFAKLQPQLGTSYPSAQNFIPLGLDSHQAVAVTGAGHIPINVHQTSGAAAAAPFDVNSIHPSVVHAQQVTSIGNATNQVAAAAHAEMQNFSASNLAIVIQPNLQVIMLQPGHKTIIKQLIEKCVHDWIGFIAERLIKVCSVTTETMVKKDFAHEPNADLMRSAAHKMMRCLVAGYSLINTEEPLLARIKASLESYFQAKPPSIPGANVSKELIDSTISTLINDNIELCVCYVQKICIERAIEEIDKRMKPDFEARQNAAAALAVKSDDKKPPASVITSKQMQIYEEMGRNIAGFTTPSSGFYSQINETAAAGLKNQQFVQNANLPTSNNNHAAAAASYPQAMIQQQLASTNSTNEPSANQTVPVAATAAASVQPQFVDHFVMIYDKLIKHLTELIMEFEDVHHTASDAVHHITDAMHQVLEVLKICKQNPRDQSTAIQLIKKVIVGLRELILNVVSDLFAAITRVRDFYLLLLKALTDQRAFNLRFTTTTVTRFVIEYWISMAQVFPDDLFDTLYRTHLINFPFMDSEFHQFLENGPNTIALNIILNFLKCYLPTIPANHFPHTLELLQRITMKVNQTNHPLFQDLKQILGCARINLTNNMEQHLIDQNNAVASSPILEKFDAIIKEWIQHYNTSKNLHASFQLVMKNMTTHGLLKNDELISRFFKTFLEACVERCYQILAYAAQHQQTSTTKLSLQSIHIKCYEYIDAFSSLVLMFVKQSGNQGNVDQKFQLLSRVLQILANTAHRDQEIHQKDFFSLTYYRILLYIFIEFFYSPWNLGMQDLLLSNDNLSEVFKWHLVKNYCNVLHSLSPLKAPSFTMAWLDIISHRVFIGKCLDNSPQINYKTWHGYFSLLSDLLMFQKPFLLNVESYIMHVQPELYKATLKLFILLFHDFPEFLTEYCYALVDQIPIRAVQLRNIILSANPINIQDLSGVKVDNLYEILPPPRVPNTTLFEHLSVFQKELDTYLTQRGPISFLQNLAGYFVVPQHLNMSHQDKAAVNASQDVNQSMINGLILYLGISFMQTTKTLTISSISNSAHMDIFQNLFLAFDSQGRYLLINSIVDHLRYPNTETLVFICLTLALFKDNDEHVREQIIRVLLERILAHHPHPWGVTYVINELIRNQQYKLLEHNFVKSVPEIEKYFSRNIEAHSH